MSKSHSGFVRFLLGTLKGIDITRRVIVDVVVIGIVVIVLIFLLKPSGPTVPESAALVLDPQGMLVEQIPNRVRRAQQRLVGQNPPPVTRVRDLVYALDTAADDPSIKLVVLDLNNFAGGSLAQLERVAGALKRFEKSGKKVIAYASNYSQGSYYLAAAASKAWLTTNQGIVGLLGLAAYVNYYKDLIGKLKVEWHVFRVGKYKSYVEPFMRNDMSPAAKEENTNLLEVMWKHYVGAISEDRGKEPADITTLVNHLPEALETARGDAAQVATQAGLVDGIKSLPELRTGFAGIVGTDPATGTYRRIGMKAYLAARQPAARIANRNYDQVAIIVAEGDIVSGSAPQGTIGSQTLSKLLARAARNDRVKAVVLDVNSPGGSALASDEILNAELALEQTGKPLVVSMSGVAASGGYWISMAGNRIYASPVTITGSVGIFGMFPTFQRTMNWAGIHRDGVETSPLADFGDPMRALGPDEAKVFQLVIQHGYFEFTNNVAHYRDLPLSHVDAIAQGRVWTGEDAKRIGLIDDFGDLHTAVKAAAKLVKLSSYGVTYIAPKLSSIQRFIIGLSGDSTVRSVATHLFGSTQDPLMATVRPMLDGLAHTLSLHDPHGVYAYCFCSAITEIH